MPAFAATAATLYVSPNGTGTACSTSQPCSLTQAKTNVRAMNNSMTGDIVVEVADGTYRLTDPLTFTAADSGTGGHSVIWKAALGARPVITGAQRATGWTLRDSAKNIWQANVGTGFDTRQLYVDGVLATRARSSINRADLTATTSGYTFTNTALNYLNSLAAPSRTEIHGIGSFTDRYSPVSGISNGTITMDQPAWDDNTFGYDTLTKPFRSAALYIENAYELLDTAGEWYLDTSSGTLYYKPLAGQNMSTADVEVPKLESLVDVGGNYASPATHITFSGLQFSGTSWLGPSTYGYASQQTGAYLTGTWDRPSDALTSCQGGCPLFEATRPHWDQMPAAVQVSAADNITFTGNRFTNLGQVGLGIGEDANAHATGVGLGADTVTATGNVFTQDAGGGIMVGGLQADAHHPSDSRMTNKNITLSNNVIHDVAIEYPGHVGHPGHLRQRCHGVAQRGVQPALLGADHRLRLGRQRPGRQPGLREPRSVRLPARLLDPHHRREQPHHRQLPPRHHAADERRRLHVHPVGVTRQHLRSQLLPHQQQLLRLLPRRGIQVLHGHQQRLP
ncbi:right-handed parallel beta-helix repeat-containing protein [Streptomyces sp. NPDC050121]|uniref:right-handed parallel beta-helix repeat-containing protein n=1 Tax=Streptomyces sp. NPDC050121 TaxID=3365601 RepID=UPI00378C25E4